MNLPLNRSFKGVTMDTHDFEGIAEQIAEALLGKGTSLNDGIKQKASDLELNPEQIKRLVEFSNRAAFQKHYKDEGNRSDMEFDVADSEKIMDDIYGKADENSIEDNDDDSIEVSDPFSDLQDKHLDLKETLKEPDKLKEKEAHEKIASSIYPRAFSDKRNFEVKDLPRLKKISKELESQMFSTEMNYFSSLEKLADVFKRYYDPVGYTDFEKTATHLGPESLPVLKDLRGYTKKNVDAPLELDSAQYYQLKTANEKLAQDLFKESLALNNRQCENVDAYNYINCKIAGVEKWLKQPA